MFQYSEDLVTWNSKKIFGIIHASKAKCLHFAKCLLVSDLPKPHPVRMVSHAAARFCETLPSEPDTPVRNTLILLRLGVQNPVHIFLDDQ